MLCLPGPLGHRGPAFQTRGGSNPVPIALLGRGWAPRALGCPVPAVVRSVSKLCFWGGPTSAWCSMPGLIPATPLGCNSALGALWEALSGTLWGLLYKSTSSVLAWRIPGTGEPGGLPSRGSHRVGQDWSDLAAAAAYSWGLCP